MEDVVNRIIAIDKDTKNVIEMTERVKKNSELELKNKLEELEKGLLEEGRILAEKEFKAIIDEGIEEVNTIKDKENSKIHNIDSFYNSKKKDLLEDLFQNLLKQNE